jgi:hypothetical protein
MILGLNGQPILQIDDSNYRDFVPDGSGLLRDRHGNEFWTGCLPIGEWAPARMTTVPFEASGIVQYDEKEVKERLESMWAAKSSLMHLTYKYDSLYQSHGTCWVHGACVAASMLLAKANLPYRVPSPASVAYHCYTNFGVRGGYPSLAVEKFQEHGAANTDLWPENGHSRRYDDPQTRADRKHNWLEEVVILGGGEEGFWRGMSAICQGIPIGCSYSWWSHYVCGCWGRVENGEVKSGHRNTWGNGYGDKGFALLAGRRKYPSWSCAFLRMRQSPGEM